jgi:16S rRNA (cytidine1402-2'-O)-methyltransferase
MDCMSKLGKLYIVATPIGNLEDVTLRARRVLTEVDAVICEEFKVGSRLLKRLKIEPKSLLAVNEHNENESTSEVLTRLSKGEILALISDAGTPVFSDPGALLIEIVTQAGFSVIPIPGPSSLMAALSILDFHLDQFVFGGFLPRVAEQRRHELQRLKLMRMAVVIMDTPYRLSILLEDVEAVFGKSHRATLAMELTQPGETILRDSLENLRKKVGGRKAEFILVIHPPSSRQRQ